MSTFTKTIIPDMEEVAGERRAGLRYQITVAAEIIELKSGTRFSTRTTDLGPGGCFVDTLMPLPVGAKVSARLSHDNIRFEATGKVTFSQAGLGMGIAFDEMAPERQLAFDAWLAELTRVRPPEFSSNSSTNDTQCDSDSGPKALDRLIRLLVRRGIISQSDANALRDEH